MAAADGTSHQYGDVVFCRRALAAPVRALAFEESENNKFLFVGMGSQLAVYDMGTGSEREDRLVWAGEVLYPAAIWAIRLYGKGADLQVLVIGQKRACVLSHRPTSWGQAGEQPIKNEAFTSSRYPPLYINWQMDYCDWVLDILPVSASRISSLLPDRKAADESGSVEGALGAFFVVGFAHNFVEIWEWKTRTKVYQTKSEPCILYSMSLYDDHDQSGTILSTSGTMFSKVLVWDIFAPSPVTPIYSLEGHEGVIFGARWDEHGKTLVTFSDDRSLRVWNMPQRSRLCLESGKTYANGATLLVSMHGHSERVWDTCYLSNQLMASVSEDSTCRIWDMQKGTCIASLRGHQGRSAWRIAYDGPHNIIATGGGDSAVRLWSVESAINRQRGGRKRIIEVPRSHLECDDLPSELQLMSARRGDFIRRLKLLGSEELLIATDHGFVYRCALSEGCPGRWKFVYKLDDGKGWEAMTVSHNNRYLVLGDDQGGVTLIDLKQPDQILEWHAHEGKIRFIYWPVDNMSSKRHSEEEELQFFTAGLVDSRLKWWKVSVADLHVREESALRTAREPYSIFAFSRGVTICSMAVSSSLDIALCGDAKGKVFLLSLGDQEVVQTISAHGHDRVSDIVIRDAESIYSASSGRPGCLVRYSYIARKLVVTSVTKMSRVLEGLERILFPKHEVRGTHPDKGGSDVEEELFLFGLRGADMVVLHLQTKCQSLQLDCGRSKRAWDLDYPSTPDGPPFTLVYHGMDKKIHLHSSSSSPDTAGVTELPSLGVPYHSRETNALQFLPRLDRSEGKTFYLVSCSVDTTCRLWKIDQDISSNAPSRLQLERTIRDHSSNVKDVVAQSSSLTDSAVLLFSGGGHCSLHCRIFPEGPMGICVAGGSLKRPGSESRIMALDTAIISRGCIVIVSGTSAGDIDIILYDEDQRLFRILSTLRGHASAILSLRLLPSAVSSSSEQEHQGRRVTLVSGGTDGKILFWDLSELATYDVTQPPGVMMDKPFSYAWSSGQTTTASHSLQRFGSIDAHQSGVNALAVQQISGGATPRYALASGGDDQSLRVTIFALHSTGDEQAPVDPEAEPATLNGSNVQILANVQALAHASAIKGVAMAGCYIFTTGPDQRLCAWRMDMANEQAKLSLVGAYFIDVADIAALHLTPSGQPCERDSRERYLVAVAGVGMQVVEVEVDKADWPAV